MLPLIRCRDRRTKQSVVVKAATDSFLRNERDILTRFRTTSSLRGLIDEVQDPPLLLLENLDSNLLFECGNQGLSSLEVKEVARAVLHALVALHEKGIVHTGMSKSMIMVISLIPCDRYQT